MKSAFVLGCAFRLIGWKLHKCQLQFQLVQQNSRPCTIFVAQFYRPIKIYAIFDEIFYFNDL